VLLFGTEFWHFAQAVADAVVIHIEHWHLKIRRLLGVLQSPSPNSRINI